MSRTIFIIVNKNNCNNFIEKCNISVKDVKGTYVIIVELRRRW
jgi:hypothetical protein